MSSFVRTSFSFEKSAVRVNDGTYLQLLRDCTESWIQSGPASYEILGEYFKVLYQLKAGGYILLDFTSNHKEIIKTSDGDTEIWSTDALPIARRVSDDEAVGFLTNAHFEIPENLQSVLDRKSKEARKPAEKRPPRSLNYWAEKVSLHRNLDKPANSTRALETVDRIIELAEMAVQNLRCWPNQSRHERDHDPLRALAARLFSQFRVDPDDWWGSTGCVPPANVDLLELRWPDGSKELRQTVAEIRDLIAAPTATLIACRFTLGHSDVPTAEEREAAENALIDSLEQLEKAVVRLRDEYAVLKSGANIDELRRKPVRRKPPSEHAILAYRLKILTGATQERISQTLTSLIGITPGQGTVSRWLKEVEEWISAGNVLPAVDCTAAKKAQSIDPAEIDKGPRLEHRTPRQRRRRGES